MSGAQLLASSDETSLEFFLGRLSKLPRIRKSLWRRRIVKASVVMCFMYPCFGEKDQKEFVSHRDPILSASNSISVRVQVPRQFATVQKSFATCFRDMHSSSDRKCKPAYTLVLDHRKNMLKMKDIVDWG